MMSKVPTGAAQVNIVQVTGLAKRSLRNLVDGIGVVNSQAHV